MNRSRDFRLPFWSRVERKSIDGERQHAERSRDDKVIDRTVFQATGSSALPVEHSRLGSMLIVMPFGVTWDQDRSMFTTMNNSKSMMDIEDICGCSKLPSIIPKKELPHLRSTSGEFDIAECTADWFCTEFCEFINNYSIRMILWFRVNFRYII